jgi:hypothetical protein
VTGVRIGPHPLDSDDLTPDIVRAVLARRMGMTNPAVDELTDDIVTRLRQYEMHRLGVLVAG